MNNTTKNSSDSLKSERQTGTVVKSTGAWYKVSLDEKTVDARLRGKLRLSDKGETNPVAVGDRVFLMHHEQDWIIAEVEERKNMLIRKSMHSGRSSHVIAANVDQAIVVLSFRKPAYKLGFLDRFLASSEAYGISALIVMNKTDLVKTEKQRQELEAFCSLYQKVGYPVLPLSIYEAHSLTEFERALTGKINVFSGQSGVGKSSLMNKIAPDLNLRTGEVSSHNEKGMHTTTFAEMLKLPFSGWVIDTPGIKEFGLVDVTAEELGWYFKDFVPFKPHCQFRNCTCTTEPGCAVKEAVNSGDISSSRYEAYVHILKNIREL